MCIIFFVILPIILFFITIHVYKNIIYDFYSEESIKKGNFERTKFQIWKLLLLVIITLIPIFNLVTYIIFIIIYIIYYTEEDIKYYPKDGKVVFYVRFFKWIGKILNKEL